MSDFLQFEDEVINGSPKYNITDNADGTKTIELANEIVHQGTAINKNTFNEFSTILGYNKLDYTQESGGEVTSQGIVGTYVPNQVISNSYSFEIKNAGTNNVNVTSDFFEQIGINITYAQYIQIIEIPNNVKKFSIQSKNTSVAYHLLGSNDKVNWTNIVSVSTSKQTISNNFKYYKCDSPYATIMFDFVADSITNLFTFPHNLFYDKKIIKVFADYLGGVTNNTLNGKTIDTILLNGHYYELLYDEPNDRFIAYEMRV